MITSFATEKWIYVMFLSAVSASVVNIFLRFRLFLAGDIELNPGPRNADYLTIKDLRVVQHALWNGRSKWYNIGIQLEVSIETLDVIRGKYSNNADECLTELLGHWLRQATHPPTWSLIISVLKSRTINLLQMASEIEKDRLETEKSSRLAEEQKTTLERNLQEKDRKLESLQKTVAELTLQNREQMTALERKIQEKASELESLKKTVAEKDKQMTKLERKIQEKNSELEAQKKIVAELKVQKSEQKSKLERKIQEKNCELESQKRIVSELKVQKIEQRVETEAKSNSVPPRPSLWQRIVGHQVPQPRLISENDLDEDPATIKQEQAGGGYLYEVADRPKKSSKKKEKSVEELAGMYSVPDKSRKRQNQLTYADIDIGIGSGKSDPATIKQKETETGDLYAVADKPKKKSSKKKEKSEDELAGMYSVPHKSKSKKGQLTYADIDIGVGSGRPVHPVPQMEYASVVNDPNTIQHEQSAGGGLYAVADKPKKGSKKDKSEVELPEMYSVPDKKKKSQLTYADIDIGVGSGRPVHPVPQMEYASVVN